MDTIAVEHEALLQFLYLAPVGLVQTSMDGTVTLMNPKAAQLLLPLQKDVGLDNLFEALDMVAPELRNMVASYVSASGTICDNVQFQVSSGLNKKALAIVLAITLIKLDAQRLMAVLSDVTESVKREKQLKHSDAWFNAILAGVNNYAVVPLDHDGVVRTWNASIDKLTKFQAVDIVGKSYSVFFPETAISTERVIDYLREADESGWSLHETWCLRADGTKFWGSCMIAPVEPLGEYVDLNDSVRRIISPIGALSERGYALVIRDMSEQRSATAEMVRTNFYDHLTGIANRRSFFDAADLEIKRWHRFPRPLSLLAIDADFFKQINDKHGHAAGDTILRHLAHTILHSVRDIDIVARIGGEEFAVLLLGTDLPLAIEVAERILQGISSQVVRIDGADIRYTVSIGVSSMSAQMKTTDDLMKAADKALYVAKNAGRNQIALAATADAVTRSGAVDT